MFPYLPFSLKATEATPSCILQECRVSGAGSGSTLLLKRPEQNTVQPGAWDSGHLRGDCAVGPRQAQFRPTEKACSDWNGCQRGSMPAK